jgi:predicted transcriptional regulator
MAKVDDFLASLSESLKGHIDKAEATSNEKVMAGIEQALADLVGAVEKLSEGDDDKGLADAIKGLKLSVTVSPTPVQVNVSPTPVEIKIPEAKGFRPLTLRVNRANLTNLIESVDVIEKA